MSGISYCLLKTLWNFKWFVRKYLELHMDCWKLSGISYGLLENSGISNGLLKNVCKYTWVVGKCLVSHMGSWKMPRTSYEILENVWNYT